MYPPTLLLLFYVVHLHFVLFLTYFFFFQISDVLLEVDNLRQGDASGYLHHISPLKNKGKFFDFQLQLKNKTIRAVCFSAKKKKHHFESFSKSKTPVKMKKFRLETKGNSEDLLMDETVSIEEFPEIDFASREIPANLTISMLKSNICVGQLLTIKAKLVSLTPVKEIKSHLKLVEGLLIDPTDCIKVTIWQEHIDDVQQGNTYIFKNLRLKKNSLTGEIYVNTAKADQTTITIANQFNNHSSVVSFVLLLKSGRVETLPRGPPTDHVYSSTL